MDMGSFDVEHLQKLTYERSTKWASFLEDVTKKETFEELPLTEIDDIIGPEFDEADSDDDMASMEEGDNHETQQLNMELFETVSNATCLTLLLNNSTFVLPETATKEEVDLVDLVNQTMPIIQEHNRQLKETGFDMILSSFDKNKIEEKVGSWLNRHNSLFGGDSTLTSECSKRDDFNSEYLDWRKENIARKSKNSKIKTERYDSDDSLQSGETARYIRSSKVGYIKKSSTSKTMIKTHCLLKSCRDTLREKYTSARDNDNNCHVNAVCYKITDEFEYHPKHRNLTHKPCNKNHNIHVVSATATKQRRKVLRKRTISQRCNAGADLSDSDYYEDYSEHSLCRNLAECCNANHCSAMHNICTPLRRPASAIKRSYTSVKQMSSARINRRYYHFQKLASGKSLSLSSSSSSSNSSRGTCDKRFADQMKRTPYAFDTRPCKRVSECICCNDKKLCKKYKHIADTSTEDWYVDYNENEATQLRRNNNMHEEYVKKSARKIKRSTNNTPVQMICNSTAMSNSSPAYKRQISDKVWLQQQKKENSSNKIVKQKPAKGTVTSNSIVTSTSIPVANAYTTPKEVVKTISATVIISDDDDDEPSDCALVTSTTNHNLLDNSKGILIYTPNNALTEADHQSTVSESYFTITKEHLSNALGEKLAEKFLKYYIGRRRFNVNSTIYYIPPKTRSVNNLSTSSDSDDCLDNLGQFGDLYECL